MELTLHCGDILTAKTAIIAYPVDSAGHVGEATIQNNQIIAPTMKHGNEPIPPKQVELATVAALRCADEGGYRSIALPPFGTVVGGVDLETAGRIIMETVQMFRCDNQLAAVEIWLPNQAALDIFKRYGL